MDRLLSVAMSAMHRDLTALIELVKELQASVNELKEGMTVEFEIGSDTSSESETSHTSAQTI